MSTFTDRVISEKAELDDKREKLEVFLTGDKINEIDPRQKVLLQEQANVMKRYSEILQERLDLL